MTASNGLSGSV